MSGRRMLFDVPGVAGQFAMELGIGSGKETLAEVETRLVAAEDRGIGRRIAG